MTWGFRLFSFALLLGLSFSSGEIRKDELGIDLIVLNDANFSSNVIVNSSDVWFIRFYAPVYFRISSMK